MQGVLLTVCLIPPFETITDNVSFLSAFGFEESALSFLAHASETCIWLKPDFIMGKNHAARETTCSDIYVVPSKKKPKIFTTACNTVWKLMMGKDQSCFDSLIS